MPFLPNAGEHCDICGCKIPAFNWVTKIVATGLYYCNQCYLNYQHTQGLTMNYFTISNGDTNEYTAFSWPLWDATGKGIKGILDAFVDKDAKKWHPIRKIWFIHNSVSDVFIRGVKQAISGDRNWSIKDQRTTVETFNDFFETPLPVGPAPKTKLELLIEFTKIMPFGVSVIEDAPLDDFKKLYRKAALALHPDRNNGDGSKMAELNIIWAELQTKF